MMSRHRELEKLRKSKAVAKPVPEKQDHAKSAGAGRPGTPLFLQPSPAVIQRQAVGEDEGEQTLGIAAADDEHEQEAHQVADQMLRIPGSRSQHQVGTAGNPEQGIQAKPAATGASQGATPAGFGTRLATRKKGGAPLPAPSRSYFEPRFGHDFGPVRIHNDPEDADLARDINARAFTTGSHIFFAQGAFQPGQSSGNRLLAHELTHVLQQSRQSNPAATLFRDPDAAKTTASPKPFDGPYWFARFKSATKLSLARLGLAGEHVIWVRAREDLPDSDDLVHPAHYNPTDRTIYFSYSGFRHLYNERVVNSKAWTPAQFERQILEVALEEAFHAYQDAPRFRSKAFMEFEAEVGPKLRKEFISLIDSGVMDTYDKFKTYSPHFTNKYLPEEKIIAFLGENAPMEARPKTWQLSAREEIMNQWLHILEDSYFRARGMVSGLRGLGKETPLPEEKKHRVSRIEKQAAGFSRIKVDEVLLAMRLKDLEAEKDPARRKKIEIEIASLEAKLDWRTRIPTLALEKKKLEKEFMALDSFKPQEHKRATVVLKRLMDISQELDSLYTLRDGVEAVMKKKQWLLPRRGD